MNTHHLAGLPRRELLKGALVVGFSLALPASSKRLSAAPVLHDPGTSTTVEPVPVSS